MGGAAAGPIIGAGIGALGNYFSSRNANKPRTTQQTGRYSDTQNQRLQPYGGTGQLDNIGNLMGLGLGYGLGNYPLGPSQMQTGVANSLSRFVNQGPYQIHGGINIPQINPAQIGELPEGPGSDALTAALERLRNVEGGDIRGLGIPVTELTPQQIAQFMPEEDAELAKIYQGHFLGENPYLDDMIEAMSEDINRNYSHGIVPQIDAAFARGGRMGSGAYAQAQADADRSRSDAIADTSAGLRGQSFEAERGRMMQGLGLRNDQIISARNQLTQMRNQDMQTAGQLEAQAMALRQQGKIAEAQILEQQAMAAYQAAVEKEFLQAQLEQQANISNAGFDLQGQSLGLQGQALGLQSNQAHMSNLMNLFGVAGGLQNEQRQGATGPLGLIGQYASTILPMLAQFGQQTSSRTGTSSGSNMQPGMGISPIGSMLAGLGGGAAQGYGLQNLIGGSKGGGGPNIMDSLSNTYGLWYQPQLGNYSGTGGR